MKNSISIIAAILAVFAIVPYLIDVVSSRTKPNVVSWFTWTLLLIIATAAAFAAHQPRTALLTLGDTIGTGMTLIFGIKYGVAKFSWFDGFCQIAALIGLALWLIFNSPVVAIIAVIIIDLFASIPTLKHSWQSPEEETWQTFAILIVAAALTLASLANFSIASLSFPIYLLLANSTVVATVIYRRNKKGLSLSRQK